MKPDGAHTHGPQGGGGGLVLVVAVVILAASGAASAAVTAMEVILIAIACLAVAAVLGGAVLLVYRARSAPGRSDRPGRPLAARPVHQLPPESRPQLEESHKPAAIEPRHENHFPAIGPGREVHYHFNVSAAELAAIMRHHTEEK